MTALLLQQLYSAVLVISGKPINKLLKCLCPLKLNAQYTQIASSLVDLYYVFTSPKLEKLSSQEAVVTGFHNCYFTESVGLTSQTL